MRLHTEVSDRGVVVADLSSGGRVRQQGRDREQRLHLGAACLASGQRFLDRNNRLPHGSSMGYESRWPETVGRKQE